MVIKENKDIDFKYNWKVFWGILKKYKWILFVTILITLLIEGIRLIDKFLFKAIVDNGTEFVSGNLLREAFVGVLLVVGGVYVGLIVLKVISEWFQGHLVIRLESKSVFDMKKKYFDHIVHLSHNFHTTHKTGSLISRLMRGGVAVERMTEFIIFNTLPLIMQLVIVGASLVYFSWQTTLVVIGTAAAFIGYSLYIQNKQKPFNVKYNETEDIEKANVGDIFTNIDSIKHFGKEQVIKDKFFKLGNKTKKANIRFADYFKWMDAGHALILSIGTLLLIYFPAVQFLNGEITLGTLVFVYTVYGNIMGPMFGFVHGVRGYYRSMADFEELFYYGKIENEIRDKERAKVLQIKKGEVEFRNVDFSYKKRKIFKNFSLKVNENEKVAFVGHSGSGKTTLVKLLYRLYDIDNGKITIDGIDTRDVKQESLRSELSIVPQECVLFDDTVYNNILFSNPSASRRDVMRAMKAAQLDKVVKGFPKKENTIVGERGVRLSGGEKQRVSIARAILANKKVIVLDEATSSLDSETEHEIQRDLEKLLKGRTSIIIAHRLSTIMKADKIVVLDKGKIVQIGKHRDLIRKPGVYKKLWNLQKGGYLVE